MTANEQELSRQCNYLREQLAKAEAVRDVIAKARKVGRSFFYDSKDKTHTPHVTITFDVDDFDARDAFATAIDAVLGAVE